METPSSSAAAADPVTSLSLSLPGSNEAPPLINHRNHPLPPQSFQFATPLPPQTAEKPLFSPEFLAEVIQNAATPLPPPQRIGIWHRQD
nr:transcription factor MYB44-like isoform X2 [Ipomoea trifida]GMD96712.1 transcription factor MYB44-like isoform X2 [Ipomoea batatas]